MNIWQDIAGKLEEDLKLVLLVVVHHEGSSPGKQGFKMIVCEDGTLKGSIGGGLTERNLVNEARELLKATVFKPILKDQVHRNKVKNSSGMICAGLQKVAFYPIYKPHLTLINTIGSSNTGLIIFNSSGIELESSSKFDLKTSYTQEKEKWTYTEKIQRKPLLYIVGAGHVGLATARLFSTLDFEVKMFDNRNGLNTYEDNVFSEKKILKNYDQIENYLQFGDRTFIIIVTQGYEFDKQVLSKVLSKKSAYIGVLGSVSKIRKMFEALVIEGFKANDLSRIDAPIGMPIKCLTPAEIAVSIAAKIIDVKNKL